MTIRTRLEDRLTALPAPASLLVVRINDTRRAEAFDGVATTVVCGSTCLSAELRAALEQTLPASTLSHS